MSVIQMMDQGKYTEGRDAIEQALWNEKTANWPRTHYTKGLLCQQAYEEGYKKKSSKLTGLYPDQLFLAYSSYEKALELDARGKFKQLISQKYYKLSNDFRQLGSDYFKKSMYEEALRAFEQALVINNSDLVTVPVDTNLVHNTALAAYEGEQWKKAITYLEGLHEVAHHPGNSLLLYQALLEEQDSVRAEEVLMEAVELHNYEKQVVVYLVNLLVQSERYEMALGVLDKAIVHRPDILQFQWSKGLVYRRMGEYDNAVLSLKKAIELDPEEAKLPYHIGVIYYNRGIELREESLKIKDNFRYQAVRAEAREQFLEAIVWLEKSYEMEPSDSRTISRLHQLYYQLQMKQKEESMKLLLD